MMNFIREEKGQGMAEYGLILAIVAIAAIAGLNLLGPAIQAMFERIAGEL